MSSTAEISANGIGDLQPQKKKPTGFDHLWNVENSELSADGSPAPKWKVWYARGMLFWAIFSCTFLLLQTIKIYTEKDAAGVSIAAYAVYIFGCIVWMVYASAVLAHPNWALIINSALAFCLAVTILVGAIIYA